MEATCTEPGNTEYYTCSICNKYFSDEAGQTEIEADSWVIAAGHSLTKTEEKGATCTESGNTEYYTCSICNKYFSDEAGKTELEENSWIIPKKSHSLTKIDAMEATCTEPGNTEYYTCSICNKYFSDEAGQIEIVGDSWLLSQKGHTYGVPIWNWSEKSGNATATFVCKNCPVGTVGHMLEKAATVNKKITEAKCTVDGKTEYTASVIFNAVKYDTSKVEKIPRKGHSIASRVDKKPTDKKEGSIVKGCGVCGYVEDRLVIPKKKLTLNLGKSAKLVSNARGCTFTLANAKKYGKYFKVDEKTGKVTTKKDYSTKIKKSIPIKVTVGGQTYTVTAKIKIPAPSVKITRKKVGDRYRYTFKYNIPKADKIKVRSNLKGMNTKVVDKYLSQPKSNADSYINLDLGKMKKVKFKIVAYYGKNVSETRVITK